MANTLKLFISPENQRLLAGSGAFNAAQTPVFYSGNKLNLELHLLEGSGVATSPYEVPFPAGSSVKVAIGTIATRPTSGQWRLSVSSTETSDLAYNASASSLQTALNAIAAVSSAGGVTVTALGDGYSVTWNTVGTKPTILAGTDTLVPSSYESIFVLQTGSLTEREIVYVELRQSPVALAESFSALPAPVASVITVSAWNGSNKVIRTSVSPDPKGGSYVLTIDGKNAVIPANASVADVRTALVNATYTTYSTITKTGSNQFDIVLTSDDTSSVDDSGLISSLGITGEIDLATSEMLAYLGSNGSVEATLEVTVTAGGEERTICQVDCLVANGVISSGAVAPIGIGTLLTEATANARFIRRDTAQSPTGADLDIIWPNLGVSLDGSDVADALSAANSPASGNAFATISDLSTWFDQSLDTTSSVNFANITTGGSLTALIALNDVTTISGKTITTNDGTDTLTILPTGITFGDSTTQSTAFIPADYLSKAGNLSGLASTSTARTNLGLGTMATETASNYLAKSGNLSGLASTSTARTNLGLGTMAVEMASNYLTTATAASTYALLSSFDQGVKTTDSPTFDTVTLTTSIVFPDASTINTAPVNGVQSNASGYTNAGFYTHYPYEVQVVDAATGTAYWVPARLV